MGVIKVVVFTAVFIYSMKLFRLLLTVPTFTTNIKLKTWGSRSLENVEIRKFDLPTPSKEDVKDLKSRIANTRSLKRQGDMITQHEPSHGSDVDAVSMLTSYWANEFDWDTSPTIVKMKKMDQFETYIGGLRIHFIHEKARVEPGNMVKSDDSDESYEVKVVPLLLVHGWPGSVLEFADSIPILTTPHCVENNRTDTPFPKKTCYAFDVVCPSLPGYGWSEGSDRPGLHALEVSRIMLSLMTRLGYDHHSISLLPPDHLTTHTTSTGSDIAATESTTKHTSKLHTITGYYVQGGDWGSVVATGMAQLSHLDTLEATYSAENKALSPVLGIHVNMFTPTSIHSLSLFGSVFLLQPNCEAVNQIQNDQECYALEQQNKLGGNRQEVKLKPLGLNSEYLNNEVFFSRIEESKTSLGWNDKLFHYLLPDVNDRERICHTHMNHGLDFVKHFLGLTGYFHYLGTRPDSVGIGFHDSPTALTSFILEKVAIWTHQPKCMPHHHQPDDEALNHHETKSNTDQPLDDKTKKCYLSSAPSVYHAIFDTLGYDWLVANMATYWYDKSSPSSSGPHEDVNIHASTPIRLYKNSMESIEFVTALISIVPGKVAIGDFPKEILRFPESTLKRRFPGLVHYEKQVLGGHFAALEQPFLFVRDVTKGIHTMLESSPIYL